MFHAYNIKKDMPFPVGPIVDIPLPESFAVMELRPLEAGKNPYLKKRHRKRVDTGMIPELLPDLLPGPVPGNPPRQPKQQEQQDMQMYRDLFDGLSEKEAKLIEELRNVQEQKESVTRILEQFAPELLPYKRPHTEITA